ncbi:PepSY domain-containing protein, partial [Dysgonomonas sp. OttesenSCG-928-M03]|nr:PepSY domain-containing protein [Dysgonomonas sp. OttesenSCG-928-M03]
IKVTSDLDRTYIASLTEGFRISVFVDPYTAEIKGIHNFRESFFYDIMTLHRWLMDGSRTWGKYTVGITTILFVFILISGIVWWVPSDKKKLKGRFLIKTGSGAKRLFHDLHVSLGIYVCLFLLVCSLTGLMWSFEWYRNGVNKLFGAEASKERGGGGHGKGEKKDKKTIEYQNWQTAFDNLLQKVPQNRYITIADGSATVLTNDAPHLRATDKYMFRSSTGEVIKADLFSESKSTSKIMAWAYALHVGAFGGIVVRILTCLACLIGATLPLTGYYIFFIKSKKKKRSKPQASTPVS